MKKEVKPAVSILGDNISDTISALDDANHAAYGGRALTDLDLFDSVNMKQVPRKFHGKAKKLAKRLNALQEEVEQLQEDLEWLENSLADEEVKVARGARA